MSYQSVYHIHDTHKSYLNQKCISYTSDSEVYVHIYTDTHLCVNFVWVCIYVTQKCMSYQSVYHIHQTQSRMSTNTLIHTYM